VTHTRCTNCGSQVTLADGEILDFSPAIPVSALHRHVVVHEREDVLELEELFEGLHTPAVFRRHLCGAAAAREQLAETGIVTVDDEGNVRSEATA
jgi:hypothetical protein